VVLAGATLVAVVMTSCDQAASEADVTNLDTDEVVSLSSELASCVEDGLGVEVAEDFLLKPDEQTFDLSQATPEQEQAVVDCFDRIQGDPVPDAPAPSDTDAPMLEVDVAGDQ
jgi:hypothetical protein